MDLTVWSSVPAGLDPVLRAFGSQLAGQSPASAAIAAGHLAAADCHSWLAAPGAAKAGLPVARGSMPAQAARLAQLGG